MPSRAVLVPALLCCIIQVAHISGVLGSDGRSHDSSSTNLEQTLPKRSLSSQGLLERAAVPQVANLSLQATLHEIKAIWKQVTQMGFTTVKFRVTTAGVDKIISGKAYSISGLACNTNYTVTVSPVNAAGADFGFSQNATIITKGVPELVNLTLRATSTEITADWSLKEPNCFPDVLFRVTLGNVSYTVAKKSYTFKGLFCNTSYIVKVTPLTSVNGVPYGVPTSGTITKKGVPEFADIGFAESDNGIDAAWFLKEPECFRNVRFRVTTAGFDQTVPQNNIRIRSGLACNTSYNVKVSILDAGGVPYGVSSNATILFRGVPVVGNLTLRATLHEITAKWSVNEPKCFPNVKFRLITTGVDRNTSQTSYNFSGLVCNTVHYVQVFPVHANGTLYGFAAGVNVKTTGVPEMANLTLQAKFNDIEARWSVKEPECFPNASFRLTAAGFDQIVSQNYWYIRVVACNTSHTVKVTPVDAGGAPYKSSRNATILVQGVPEVVNLTLQTSLNEIIARWSQKQPKCFPNVTYSVTTMSGFRKTVTQNSLNISGLPCRSLENYVSVSPVNASGAISGVSASNYIQLVQVPVVVNLTIQDTRYGITARWSLDRPECFPNMLFDVSSRGIASEITMLYSGDFSVGLVCNNTYNLKVSPVDVKFAPYGVSTNANFIYKGVPVLVNLTLQATLNVITAKWSLKDPKCFPGMRFRVTTAGVNTTTSQNSYNISEPACDTAYDVNVSPVGADGSPYGVSESASIRYVEIPEVVNLTLQATPDEITARWSLKETRCFPNESFRVTTAGVDQTVSQNSYNISGLACNTSYVVKVIAVDSRGSPYGVSTNTTITTNGGNELVNLTLQSTKLNEITASWSLKDSRCLPSMRFRVTTAGVNITVSGNSTIIPGLTCNTIYDVTVTPINPDDSENGKNIAASIMMSGDPELVNLNLQASLREIIARWSLKDPECFPNATFRVISTGVDTTTSQNDYNISGLTCNTSYNVLVTPINAAGLSYGVSTNATIITKGVPELVNLDFQVVRNDINVSWSLKDPNCFSDVRFRVTTAGGDKIVTGNSYIITGLACNQTHDVKVSPVDANGADYGVSSQATIWKTGVPEVTNLILQATGINELTASWSMSEPRCFPDMEFRITTTGVNTTVTGNSYKFTGLPCDTIYNIMVAPTNALGGETGGFSTAYNRTLGALSLSVNPMVAETLVAKWSPAQSDCSNYADYEVTIYKPRDTFERKIITKKTHLVFGGLNASTAYLVRVQPRNSLGQLTGHPAIVPQITFDASSGAGRCPKQTIVVAEWPSHAVCAEVVKPTPSTNYGANLMCYNLHPATSAFPYLAMLYTVPEGWATYGKLQEYLRMFDYKEELVLNAVYKDGSWVWGFAIGYDSTFPIDPALLAGLPAGGVGPNDYKMLYADPAKDYGLSAAKEGRAFGGLVCLFPVPK